MIKFTKPHFYLYILNGLAVAVYFVVFSNLNQNVSHEIVFSTPDALTYMDVANWIANGIDSESVSIRPILYPLILMITTNIGGAYGIWMMQVLFFILTINFTFLGIKKLTRSYVFSFLGAIIIMSNLSLIALTLHALTEVTTVFLLSTMLFFLSRKINNFREVSFFHSSLFFLVLLTILKPVFLIPLFGVLFIVFPLFYFKKYWKGPKNFLKLLLILLPLFIQYSIIKIKYDQTKISLISSWVFSNYFVAKGIQEIESVDYSKAKIKVKSFSSEDQTNYIVDHIPLYFRLFKKNIINNITGKSRFLLYPKGYENNQLAVFMKTYNIKTLKVHYIFIVLVFLLLIILLIKKDYPTFIFLLFTYLLGAYLIISTGISFWQGDRLTLPAIGIWAFIYPLILFYYIKLLYQKLEIDGLSSKS